MSHKRKIPLYATVAIVAIILVAVPAAGAGVAGPPAGGKVVVLVIDRIGIADLTPSNAPFLRSLAGEWSAGLMIARSAERETGREPDLGADYVTLGAGAAARGSRKAPLSFDAEEVMASAGGATTAGRYLEASTGATAPPGGVACLGAASIYRNNEAVGSAGCVGQLSARLAEAGRKTAVAGNQDTSLQVSRLAPLVACGPDGVVSSGRVAGLTLPAPREPGGVRTDMEALAVEAGRLLEVCDVLVIDTGDTGRVDRQGDTMELDALSAARAVALKRADAFAGRLARSIDLESSLLLVVSPGAPMQARLDGDYATPFIAAGRGFGRGLLASGSTRRPGFVSNADFLSTVLGFFELGTPAECTGAAMETAGKAPSGGTLGYLENLDRQYVVTRTARWPVVLGYLICVGLFLLLALACVPAVGARLAGLRGEAPGGRRGRGWRASLARFLEPASPVVLAMPLSFLLVSAFSYESWLFPLAFCILYALAVGLGAHVLARRNRRLDAVTLVCLFSACVMFADLLFGGSLFIVPLLGSSAQDGLRFYGMSNAVSGMMIAYALWGLAGLGGEKTAGSTGARLAVLLGLALMSFTVGFGRLGGDFGGFIAAVVVSLVFVFATSRGGFKGWRIPAIAAATVAAAGLMIGVDALFVHTHAGHSLTAGSGRTVAMLARKTTVLLGQIKSVLFLALLLIATVIALALWMKRPDSMWRRRWESDRAFTAALFSLLLGSFAALLLNDTGIGMMGTMVMITIPVATYHFTRQGAPGAPFDE